MSDIEEKGEVHEVDEVHDECCNQGCGCHDENMEKIKEKEESLCVEEAEEVEESKENLDVEKVTEDSEVAEDLMSQAGPASPPPLTIREYKALKKSRYMHKKDKFDKAFVIRNKRTGQVVEIQASNAFQAAGFIGWRPRHIETIEVNDLSEKE